MKRLAIILCFLLFFSSCKRQPEFYIYPNSVDRIVSVELLENKNSDGFGIDEDGFAHIRYLEREEVATFIGEVRSLETRWWKSGPLWGYGPFFAKVFYDNGDIEILGVGNIEFIPSGEVATGFSRYCYKWSQFMDVFSKYAQMESIP